MNAKYYRVIFGFTEYARTHTRVYAPARVLYVYTKFIKQKY